MKSALWLSLIISFRFLGLFLVMPLISLYALSQESASSFLVGLAVGGYALIQMFLQYPFGKLSDRFGRKKIIILGLLLFAAGSVVCALSSDIYTLIIGRLLQGAGAISSTVTAMIGDLTKEEERGKAMAMMGGSIGMAFIISLLAGPVIGGAYGIESLFAITAVLSILAVVVLFTKVPTPAKLTHFDEEGSLKGILRDTNLMKLNFSMFFHSVLMTTTFFMIPVVFVHQYGWERGDLYQVFIPSVIAGILAMGAGVMIGEKKGKIKTVFIIGILFIAAAYLLASQAAGETAFIVYVAMLFIGINMVEPIIQSTATKFAKAKERGRALGVFNTFQFFGVFVGGITAAYLMQHQGYQTLNLAAGILAIFWFLFTLFMNNPPMAKNLFIEEMDLEKVKNIEGVLEYYFSQSDKKYVIRYDKKVIDEEDLKKKLRS